MKISKFLFGLLFSMLVMPSLVFAKDNTSVDNGNIENKEVKIYFFRGEGCPHCAEAEAFFKSIEDEYGSLFEVVDFETYLDQDNQQLLEKIGELRDEDVSGVPYILIGRKSWSGYGADYNEPIIKAIKEEYEKDVSERYDILEIVNEPAPPKNYKNDIMISIIIILCIVTGVVGISFARKKTI